MLDEIVNGRTAGPAGHDSLTACPHGVYPTAGTERYIAIAVETAEQWRGAEVGRASHRPLTTRALMPWTNVAA